MNRGEEALARWLRRLETRSPLTDRDRATVMEFPGVLREHRSSRDIVRLGERTQQSLLVVEGTVARFGQTVSGTRQLTALYIAGDMADLHSAVLPVVSAPLQSTGSVVVYRVPHDAIQRAAERSPTLARAFWRDCVADAQVASEWLLNIGRRSALARLANLMCELALRHEAAGIEGPFRLALTQAHLGEALGLTGVHVNRTLRALREQGLIATEGGQVSIVDRERLASVGEFNPAYLHLGREVDA